jgi:hypothetical protein
MREKFFRWPLGVLAWLALVVSQASANLLTNAGFEDPITSDGAPFVGFWEGFSGGGTSTTTDTVMPRNGAGHLSLNFNNNNNAFAGAFQDVEGLIPGQLMNFSVWHKSQSLPYNLVTEARIEWRKAGQAAEVSRTANLTTPPTGDYTLTSVIAAVPAGADTARVVYAVQSFTNDGLPDTGTVYVDDASVTVVPEPATVVLLGLAAMGCATAARRYRRV